MKNDTTFKRVRSGDYLGDSGFEKWHVASTICRWLTDISSDVGFFTDASPLYNDALKGEVRTINDRNICERRSHMKNNGKSPTFKFVSGEERRPSEVQRVSLGRRLSGATHSSADLTWIRKWLQIQAPELSELESVELELGSWCSDLDKQVSDEICQTRKRQFEISFRLSAGSCPRVTSCSIPPGRLSRKRRRTDRKDFYHVPHCNGSPVGVRGQRGDRKIQGRQKMCRDRGSNSGLRN